MFTADTFCDGKDCSVWVEGLTSYSPPLKQEARKIALCHGWHNVKGKDYCPRCYGILQLQDQYK